MPYLPSHLQTAVCGRADASIVHEAHLKSRSQTTVPCPRALEPQPTLCHCSGCWTCCYICPCGRADREPCPIMYATQRQSPGAHAARDGSVLISIIAMSIERITLPSSDTNEEASGILFPSRNSGDEAESRFSSLPCSWVVQWGRGKRPFILPTTPRALGLVGLLSRVPAILAEAKTGSRWCSLDGKSTSRATVCCSCVHDQIASHVQSSILRKQTQVDTHASMWNMKDTQDFNGCKQESKKLGMGR
jgi:hypothetical protein